ncbi:hypothetical protein MTO96_022839 [Rhipicephalus appendiculatus]
MSKSSVKRKSSRRSKSIPVVLPDKPRHQPAAVQDAAPEAIKTATAPPPPVSQIASPAVQVGVEQRSRTLPAVAALLGAAISAFIFALVVVALLGSAKAGRSSRNASSFCCVSEALIALSVVDSSISPCEDFYAHVCSRVDADAGVLPVAGFSSHHEPKAPGIERLGIGPNGRRPTARLPERPLS